MKFLIAFKCNLNIPSIFYFWSYFYFYFYLNTKIQLNRFGYFLHFMLFWNGI